ncbi:MAG: hypothetical protein OEM02_03145 [Desulfobulbaceae bacterium]|nr:hypothetical protein [Desulfobulbaceae bacterium]
MSLQDELRANEEYIVSEGLDKIIDFAAFGGYSESVFDNVSGKLKSSFPPEAGDLVRLHKLIRSRKCFTVLEFGVGYSTIVMADALRKNQQEWEALSKPPEVRNRFMFQIFTVDTSKKWLATTRDRIPAELAQRMHLSHSEVEIGTFNGQLCHYYKQLPNIVPDFIYLDGPDPKAVQGEINGLSFQCDERTVMSGDLLLMESIFLPGTFILVDGRTNNVRFLQRNFTRDYEVKWDMEGDVTTFELQEERLGKYNLVGSDFLPTSVAK